MKKPRAWTTDEVRDKFIEQCLGNVRYWATLEGERTVEERLAGLMFSTLVLLDGGSCGMPGFHVVPCPHKDDAAYNKANGDNWYPRLKEDPKHDIAGELHGAFSAARRNK